MDQKIADEALKLTIKMFDNIKELQTKEEVFSALLASSTLQAAIITKLTNLGASQEEILFVLNSAEQSIDQVTAYNKGYMFIPGEEV